MGYVVPLLLFIVLAGGAAGAYVARAFDAGGRWASLGFSRWRCLWCSLPMALQCRSTWGASSAYWACSATSVRVLRRRVSVASSWALSYSSTSCTRQKPARPIARSPLSAPWQDLCSSSSPTRTLISMPSRRGQRGRPSRSLEPAPALSEAKSCDAVPRRRVGGVYRPRSGWPGLDL